MEQTQMTDDVQTGRSKSSEADVLLSLESMIKSHVESIAKLKDEKKKKAEMLKDAYSGDSVYHELDEKAKDARKQATVLKNQILQVPANKTLAAEVKDIRIELKEKQEALSDYLLEYKRMSGATQLELFDGEFGEIVLSAKIVKRSRSN